MQTKNEKVCSKCGLPKPLTSVYFHRLSSSKDGFRPRCKPCVNQDIKESKLKHHDKVKERQRRYREENKDKIREASKEYVKANRDKISARRKKWTEANQDKIRAANKAYREATAEHRANYRKEYYAKNKDKFKEYATLNRERIRQANNVRERKRRREEPAFKLTKNIRCRFRMAIRNESKRSSVLDLLSCSIDYLKSWIELHFDEGMNWANYGEWHIDHIRPVCTFEDPQDPACWHWSNLRPLWAVDNFSRPKDGSDID